jgi:hypothetical protein
MSYQFAGFFVKEFEENKLVLSDIGFDIKTVRVPFSGIAIRFPQYFGKEPKLKEIYELATNLGFGKTAEWIFLVYDCWAGHIDYIWGFVHTTVGDLGPILDFSFESVEQAYIELMAYFGVSKKDSLEFPVFYRDFWN